MNRQTQRLVVSHGMSAVAMSMPWPALLAATWSTTHSEALLGAVGAARMAPYVLLSWAAGWLADRVSRQALVQVSTPVRAGGLGAVALLLAGGHLTASIVAATLVVAVGTPAYPALAAAMPATAGPRSESATNWLVTLEVSAFVVGPALGGLILGTMGSTSSIVAAAALAVIASVLLRGARVAAPLLRPVMRTARGNARGLLGNPAALRVIVAVTLVNGVIGAVGVALIPLSELTWSSGDQAFGLTTAALGFGALMTPTVRRMLKLSSTAVAGATLLVVAPLLGVTTAPTWWWALAPLALLGAGATQVECAATNVIQQSVPDDRRAFALGVTDTAMVTVSLLGAATAPALAEVAGPRVLLLGLAVVMLACMIVTHLPSTAKKRARTRAGTLDEPGLTPTAAA